MITAGNLTELKSLPAPKEFDAKGDGGKEIKAKKQDFGSAN